MKGLVNELSRLGVSITEFERLSRVSFNTLKKMDAGEKVKASTEGKVKFAIKEIKEQMASRFKRGTPSEKRKH